MLIASTSIDHAAVRALGIGHVLVAEHSGPPFSWITAAFIRAILADLRCR